MATERIILKEQSLTHLSPFPRPVIFLVNPGFLTPHEMLFEHKLSKIDFSSGWCGPAIPVAAEDDDFYRNCHIGQFEHFTPSLHQIKLLMLDGHHRWEMAKKAGLSRAPVELFPYQSEHIVVDRHREEENLLTKADVLSVLNSGHVYPPESTKHLVKGLDGVLRPISAYQHIINYPSLGYGSHHE